MCLHLIAILKYFINLKKDALVCATLLLLYFNKYIDSIHIKVINIRIKDIICYNFQSTHMAICADAEPHAHLIVVGHVFGLFYCVCLML